MHSVILKRAYFLIKSLIPNQVASVTSKLECTYNEVNQANQVKKESNKRARKKNWSVVDDGKNNNFQRRDIHGTRVSKKKKGR